MHLKLSCLNAYRRGQYPDWWCCSIMFLTMYAVHITHYWKGKPHKTFPISLATSDRIMHSAVKCVWICAWWLCLYIVLRSFQSLCRGRDNQKFGDLLYMHKTHLKTQHPVYRTIISIICCAWAMIISSSHICGLIYISLKSFLFESFCSSLQQIFKHISFEIHVCLFALQFWCVVIWRCLS